MNLFDQTGKALGSLGSIITASGFKTVDLIILIVYLCLLIFLGLFLGRTKKGEEKSASDYFLAGNTLTWWAVGASLIAANISAEQLIGMSGTGFRDGIATAAYEIMSAQRRCRCSILRSLALPLCVRKPYLRSLARSSRHRADPWTPGRKPGNWFYDHFNEDDYCIGPVHHCRCLLHLRRTCFSSLD